jgi:hypothetical protein
MYIHVYLQKCAKIDTNYASTEVLKEVMVRMCSTTPTKKLKVLPHQQQKLKGKYSGFPVSRN